MGNQDGADSKTPQDAMVRFITTAPYRQPEQQMSILVEAIPYDWRKMDTLTDLLGGIEKAAMPNVQNQNS